jgi:hypothetical protein
MCVRRHATIERQSRSNDRRWLPEKASVQLTVLWDSSGEKKPAKESGASRRILGQFPSDQILPQT